MATKSRIVESSFRLGAGRYIQESGATRRLGEEVTRLHAKKPLIVGGHTALSLALDNLTDSLKSVGMTYEVWEYPYFCNRREAEEYAAYATKNGFDCFVAVGGGNICDLCKLAAQHADLPVITVPTSGATCASYTPLSVTYTDDCRANGSVHLLREVSAVLADMDILCRQPERLFASGVYDAMAKLIETKQRLQSMTEDTVDIGLASSYTLSTFIYDKMTELLPQATEDIRAGRNTKAVYDMEYMVIAVTGVISGLARGSNQCALAHKIYETARLLYPAEVRDKLHGEMVAIGLIAQLYYNAESEETVENFCNSMKNNGLPTTLHGLGIPATRETLESFHTALLESSAMAGTNEEEHKKLHEALEIIL